MLVAKRSATSSLRNLPFDYLRACNFLRLIFHNFSGGYVVGVTPVPIPNTEVKPAGADGTARVTVWESRKSPGLFQKPARLVSRGLSLINSGDFLLSHTVTRAVPSAPAGLTSVFGMGTGGTLPTESPENHFEISNFRPQISKREL